MPSYFYAIPLLSQGSFTSSVPPLALALPNSRFLMVVLKGILSSVCNISFSANTCISLWLQASLPVKFSGLGMRSAVHLAPSAFLSFVAGSLELTICILPPDMHDLPYISCSGCSLVYLVSTESESTTSICSSVFIQKELRYSHS